MGPRENQTNQALRMLEMDFATCEVTDVQRKGPVLIILPKKCTMVTI